MMKFNRSIFVYYEFLREEHGRLGHCLKKPADEDIKGSSPNPI